MHFDLPPIDQQAERLIELGVHEMAGLSAAMSGRPQPGTVMSDYSPCTKNWLRLQF